jgi:uncharacterized protein (DUF433 family)
LRRRSTNVASGTESRSSLEAQGRDARPVATHLRKVGEMASLDWSQCPAVESIPGKVGGAWVFLGTRTPVASVFENLEDGLTIDEVVEQFAVSREQVKAVLEFAVRSLDVSARAR